MLSRQNRIRRRAWNAGDLNLHHGLLLLQNGLDLVLHIRGGTNFMMIDTQGDRPHSTVEDHHRTHLDLNFRT